MTDAMKSSNIGQNLEITRDTIEQIFILAQLELTEEETENAVVDMKKILDYFSQIETAVENAKEETAVESGIEETEAYMESDEGLLREDVLRTSPADADLLKSNAPAWQKDMLVVPKTF